MGYTALFCRLSGGPSKWRGYRRPRLAPTKSTHLAPTHLTLTHVHVSNPQLDTTLRQTWRHHAPSTATGALNDLGVALYEADNDQEALAAFRAAVHIDSHHPEAADNAAQLEAFLGL